MKFSLKPQGGSDGYADGSSAYIDPDFIAKQKFGDWNSPKSVPKAANYAQEMWQGCNLAGENPAISIARFGIDFDLK